MGEVLVGWDDSFDTDLGRGGAAWRDVGFGAGSRGFWTSSPDVRMLGGRFWRAGSTSRIFEWVGAYFLGGLFRTLSDCFSLDVDPRWIVEGYSENIRCSSVAVSCGKADDGGHSVARLR
jgi:hypothetical protein